MKLKKLPLFAKLGWSACLVSTFVMSGWSHERSFIGFIIVIAAWVGTRIITEAFEAAIELTRPNLPPPDESRSDGWTKDNW